jgi:hypothetical protein
MLRPLHVKRERNIALTWVLGMRINNDPKAMPRYFFHVREGSTLHRDTEGQELPDAEAARREAISSSREMLGEKLLHGGALNGRNIEIADETGHVVDVINSRDVLFSGGQFRDYPDDVTQTAPTNAPSK